MKKKNPVKKPGLIFSKLLIKIFFNLDILLLQFNNLQSIKQNGTSFWRDIYIHQCLICFQQYNTWKLVIMCVVSSALAKSAANSGNSVYQCYWIIEHLIFKEPQRSSNHQLMFLFPGFKYENLVIKLDKNSQIINWNLLLIITYINGPILSYATTYQRW